MKYKLVILDFDGTLANSLPWAIQIVNQVAEKFKFAPIREEEIEALRGGEAMKVIKERGVSPWKLARIVGHLRKLMGQQIDQIHLFEGVELLLQQLSQAGVLIALVTTNAEANVRHVLGPQNAAVIQAYECGVGILGKKGKLRKLLRKFHIKPEEALCIGDELRDIAAAHKAHIPFGAVSWGYTRIEALLEHTPAEVFTSMNQISQVVLEQPHE